MERGRDGTATELVSLFENKTVAESPARAGWTLPRWLKTAVRVLVGCALLVGAYFAGLHTWIAARVMAGYTKGVTFEVAEGLSPRPATSASGPYDSRLGYHQLPDIIERLRANGHLVTHQARVSGRFEQVRSLGFFPLYPEKTQAGLRLIGHDGGLIVPSLFPERIYSSFDAVPPLVATSLLFLENRELLNDHDPHSNPAVEWDRLAAAIINQAGGRFLGGEKRFGASTLATQLEKVRHSPDGVTGSAGEKVRQMGTATLRSYLGGPRTDLVRRQILTNYLNSLPVGAQPGYGEVIGLRDGMRAWFGLDPDSADIAMRHITPVRVTPEAARAYRAALALLLAQRRPSHYLQNKSGQKALEEITDSHLRILAVDSVIPETLAAAALKAELEIRTEPLPGPASSFVERKAINSVRSHLVELIGADNLYQLDRFDLIAQATIDPTAQRIVTERILDLGRRGFVDSAGLTGERLLAAADPSLVAYSFVLYELTPQGNAVRIQVDNLDRPFDLNSGARLELGSTAKLRTLITYLELMAGLHGQLAFRAVLPDSLRYPLPDDPLTNWARSFLARHPAATLRETLDSAMQRTYSGSPAEAFFTGGGVHRFRNFDSRFDYSAPTIAEGFRHSVNLVFVRLMRDIVRYHEVRLPDEVPSILSEGNLPERAAMLERYADTDGRLLIERYYRRHKGRGLNEMISLMAGTNASTERWSRVYLAVAPEATPPELMAALNARSAARPADSARVDSIYQGIGRTLVLGERGQLAGVHPLEVWVVGWLRHRPDATLQEIQRHAVQSRQEAHDFLFQDGRWSRAQDRAVRVSQEREAFKFVHAAWRRLGYPYEDLVPSLGSSIGSSGDRPGALADLVGILLGDGIRRPVIRTERLHFAAGTPFETVLEPAPDSGVRVLAPEIAAVARAALADVVEEGTAGALRGALPGPDSTFIVIGGKTGTGNNQQKIFARGGRQIGARTMSRTATFVFYVGDRFYGVVTAYVDGPAADGFGFTSGLPVRIVQGLLPDLAPLLRSPGTD